jgi:hypothetical protein
MILGGSDTGLTNSELTRSGNLRGLAAEAIDGSNQDLKQEACCDSMLGGEGGNKVLSSR